MKLITVDSMKIYPFLDTICDDNANTKSRYIFLLKARRIHNN